VESLHAYYGLSHVLFGVSLVAHRGEVVALLGRNGAGKSTTLRSIMGLAPPRSGQVLLDGQEIAGWPPHRVCRAGLGFVPEDRRIFGDLTVAENLEVGRRPGPWTVEAVVEFFPVLGERRKQEAGTLSGGEQQMLAIGRALMATPRVLLLDEPSMGLAPNLVEQIFETILEIHRSGTAILLVEQNASQALAIADRGYVLQTGRIILADSAVGLAANEDVRRSYLGEI
jgi:branched-chain amino acid transport system ATP-binding protein